MANQFDSGRIASILTKEFLENEYVKNRRFIKDISYEVGCSTVTVSNYLKKFGINIETRYDERPRRTASLPYAHSVLTEEYLREEYVNKKRSINSISVELNCSNSLVSSKLQQFGIEKEDRLTMRTHLNYLMGNSSYGIAEDDGYLKVLLPKHHLANDSGYVRLHVVLAEFFYGRRLKHNEIVHHVNGDKMDNRKQNLLIMTEIEHNSLHFPEKSKSMKMGKLKQVKKIC